MNNVNVEVTAQYLGNQSHPKDSRYVYSYTVVISNNGAEPATLIGRHWIITDGNSDVQEVKGLGVVGEQPTIGPGESYSYTSGAVLQTSSGLMQGNYTMQDHQGNTFEAKIPPFALISPSALH